MTAMTTRTTLTFNLIQDLLDGIDDPDQHDLLTAAIREGSTPAWHTSADDTTDITTFANVTKEAIASTLAQALTPYAAASTAADIAYDLSLDTRTPFLMDYWTPEHVTDYLLDYDDAQAVQDARDEAVRFAQHSDHYLAFPETTEMLGDAISTWQANNPHPDAESEDDQDSPEETPTD